MLKLKSSICASFNQRRELTINNPNKKDYSHIPVMPGEVCKFLNTSKTKIFFDGTVGLGGHSSLILKLSPNHYLYGTDKDIEALHLAEKKMEAFKNRFTLYHADFKELLSLPIDLSQIDGFLFDLGVSSFQLDNPEKGFAYAHDAPLDMRMNKNQSLTADQVVNHYSYSQLMEIFKTYGEMKNPIKIVRQIIYQRKLKKIERTTELKNLIRKIFPHQRTMDPLSRIFQALRIEVNQELNNLDSFFLQLINQMKPKARLVIISFHSLEDRIAKIIIKKAKEMNLVTPLTKKPITPSEEEKAANPRARSAKLRAAEKL